MFLHFLDEKKEQPASEDIKDMSVKSARAVIMVAFGGVAVKCLTVTKHLWPLCKELKVKSRSKSKYELIKPLAIGLVEQGYIKFTTDGDENVDFVSLKSNQLVKANKGLPVSHLEPEPEPLSMKLIRLMMILILIN